MNEKKKELCCGCYQPRTPSKPKKEMTKSKKGNFVYMDSPMSTWSHRDEI